MAEHYVRSALQALGGYRELSGVSLEGKVRWATATGVPNGAAAHLNILSLFCLLPAGPLTSCRALVMQEALGFS